MSSLKKGLWSLIGRVLGRPGARHGIPDFVPQGDPSPSAPDLEAAASTETPAVASPPELAPVQSSSPPSPAARLASIRLIFTDGSVVPLSEGSLEGRQAQYLARRVLETGKDS